MLLYFTDAATNKSVAVNPDKVAVVFTGADNTDVAGKTVIALVSGSLVVTEDVLSVVGRINGELK